MAQVTQIIPKYSFPYVETVINDYTEVTDPVIEDTVDSWVKQIYVVTSSKGIDNTWVKKSSRESAVKTFGESNFNLYGQPLMQALAVVDKEDTEAWIMRVMPENATYANAIVSAFFKADSEEVEASKRKFRIKMESKTYENVISDAIQKNNLDLNNGTVDAEGYTQKPYMAVRYSGRGKCGNSYSMRISQPASYEKEYGIKMYDFEIMNYENGLTKDYDYVASMVTSPKYQESTIIQINDLLLDAEVGLPPVDVFVKEERIDTIYNAYIEFAKKLHDDLEVEYETKLVDYGIPQDQMDGTAPLEPQYKEQYAELKKIEKMIADTEEIELPDEDQFDLIYGRKVGSDVLLPGIYFVKHLDESVDITADDYDPADYTEDEIVDFSSAKGLIIENGGDGYFETPRTGKTYEEEVEECMNNAFAGEYDKKILSAKRLPLTICFDANYPYSVKLTMADMMLARNTCPVRLDCGIIDSLSVGTTNTLIKKYAAFNDRMESVDIHNYEVRDPNTNKHCVVTINYFLATQFCDHYNNTGYYVPFVKEATRLTGHIKDSLKPIVEDYNIDVKELLASNRFNYYECVRENTFYRATQNTRQVKNTDLLEENNVITLCELKRAVEFDLQTQIYNFADSNIREDFVTYENAKFENWNSRVVQSIEFSFATSEYEFEHSILHLYVAVVFRGLTKRVILEIDINKRQYVAAEGEEAEVEAE